MGLKLVAKHDNISSSPQFSEIAAEIENILLNQYEEMPRQLKIAAKYVLENPKDVLFCSMRELARRAKVAHSTMMRLVHWLGYDTFGELRSHYQSAFPNAAPEPAAISQRNPDMEVDAFIASFTRQASRLIQGYGFPKPFVEASRILACAPRIFCIGLASQYPVAQQFAYTLRHIRKSVILLDDAGGMASDALWDASPADVLLVISTAPYARAVVDVAREAARRQMAIVALTDDRLSPLVRLAAASILVSLPKVYYFQSIAPISAAAEILVALVARRSNVQAGDPVQLTLDRFGGSRFCSS